MASSSNVCSVCGGRYRGAYLTHAGTKRHRARSYRLATFGTTGRRSQVNPSSKRRQRQAAGRRALRSQDAAQRSELVTVKPHRRSPPNDGNRKLVRVKRYVRRPGEIDTDTADIAGERYVVRTTRRNRRTLAIVPLDRWLKRQGWA